MSVTKYLIGAAVLLVCVSSTASVSLMDIVSWSYSALSEGDKQPASAAAVGNRQTSDSPPTDSADSLPKRSCHCAGPSCMCCVEFNLTYIDLGGPGCVRLKYLGQDKGLAVNVSYGDSLLHSETVKGTSPAPACMNILTELAQICARFVSMTPALDAPGGEGLRTCLRLEPTLLGDVQATYPVGCFQMGPSGMEIDTSKNETETDVDAESGETGSGETGSTESPNEELSEASIIEAVSETAEEGIALLSNWLGLALGGDDANNSTTPAPTAPSAPSAPTAPSSNEGADGASSTTEQPVSLNSA